MAQKSGLIRETRGITPVLSSLLLMVIAVAAMAIATTATYIITTDLKETMSERLMIEDVSFRNSTSQIRIYLRNIGKVSIHVSAVYVNHTKQSFDPSPFNLEIGGHDLLSISFAWFSGNLYYLDIVTSRGLHVADYYEAS
jgi:hypothetical protein